jgi:hypothetical protein
VAAPTPASTLASERLLLAFVTLAALQGCGSCVGGEQKTDPAPAQPTGSVPTKLTPLPGDKSVPLENKPRSYLDGGH